VNSNLKWQYNEMRQAGTGYADAAKAQVYEPRMQKLLNIKEGAR